MMETQTLLCEYARNGSESAFRELVARYLNFIYSTAIHRMGKTGVGSTKWAGLEITMFVAVGVQF